MLDHDAYNRLLPIRAAAQAFTNRQELFQKIAPLLARAEFQEKYCLCLVHNHFLLQPGERMVATGLVTQPERVPDPTPSDIIPSSWTATGIPFEWTRVNAPEEIIAPPPDELIREFSEIVGEGSILGLCLAPGPLPEGQMWLERLSPDLRQHILEMKPAEEHCIDPASISTACWRVKISSDGGQLEPSITIVGVCWCPRVKHSNGTGICPESDST
jgi:hypothetical protein